MAEIVVPVVLEPTKASEQKVSDAVVRAAQAETAAGELEASKRIRASESAEARITGIVEKAAGERVRSALDASVAVAKDAKAKLEERQAETAKQTEAERRAADASVALATTATNAVSEMTRRRAAEEGELRNQIIESYADQEKAAWDYRDAVAGISTVSITAAGLTQISEAAADVKGYFTSMASSALSWVAAGVLAFDKYALAFRSLVTIKSGLIYVKDAAVGLARSFRWIGEASAAVIRGIGVQYLAMVEAVEAGLTRIVLKAAVASEHATAAAVLAEKIVLPGVGRTPAWGGKATGAGVASAAFGRDAMIHPQYQTRMLAVMARLSAAVEKLDSGFRALGATAVNVFATVAEWGAKAAVVTTAWLGEFGRWALKQVAMTILTVKIINLGKSYIELVKAGLPLVHQLEYTAVLYDRLAGSVGASESAFAAMDAARARGAPFGTEEMQQAVITLERLGAGAFVTAEGLTSLSDAAIVADVGIERTSALIGELFQVLRLAADGSDEARRLIVETISPLTELGVVSQEAGHRLAELNRFEPNIAAAEGFRIVTAELERFEGAAEDVGDTYQGLTNRLAAETDRLSVRLAKPFENWGKLLLRVKMAAVQMKHGIVDAVSGGVFGVKTDAVHPWLRQLRLVTEYYWGIRDAAREAAQAAREAAFAAAPPGSETAIAPFDAGPVGAQAGSGVWRASRDQSVLLEAAMDARELGQVYSELERRLQDLEQAEEDAAEEAAALAAEFLASAQAVDRHMASVIAAQQAADMLAANQEKTRRAAMQEEILGHPGVEQATEDLERYRAVLAGLDSDWSELDPESRARAWEGYADVLVRAEAAGVALGAAEVKLIDYHRWYADAVEGATTQNAAFADSAEMIQHLMDAGILRVVQATETTTAWDHALARLADTTGGKLARALRQHVVLVAGIELAWRKVSEGTADAADVFLTANDRMLTGLSLTAVGFESVAAAAGAMSAEVGAAGRVVAGAAGVLSGVAAGAPGGPVGMLIGGISSGLSALTEALGANTAAQRAAVAAYERGLDQARSSLGLTDIREELSNMGRLWFGGRGPDGEAHGPLPEEQRKRAFMRFGETLQRGHEAGLDLREVMGPLGGHQAEGIRNAYLWTLDLLKDIREEEKRRLKIVNEIANSALEEARAVRNDLTASYRGMEAALRHLSEAADSAFDVRPLEAAIERMRELGLLTDGVADAYRALADAAHVDWRGMLQTAGDYGIGQGHLGAGFEQARTTGLGGEIASAFKLLTDGGGDPLRVAVGLLRTAIDEQGRETGEGGLLDLLQRAGKSGALLPPELKPALDALAAAGIQTEAIGKVTYGDPLGGGRKSLFDLLSEINETVHEAAIEEADQVIRSIEDLRDAQLAVVREQTDRLVTAIEEGRFSPEDIAEFLNRPVPEVDNILRSSGLPASEPEGGFAFDLEGYMSALALELDKLTPNPEQWAGLVEAINQKHGLDPDTIELLGQAWRDGLEITFTPIGQQIVLSISKLDKILEEIEETNFWVGKNMAHTQGILHIINNHSTYLRDIVTATAATSTSTGTLVDYVGHGNYRLTEIREHAANIWREVAPIQPSINSLKQVLEAKNFAPQITVTCPQPVVHVAPPPPVREQKVHVVVTDRQGRTLVDAVADGLPGALARRGI